MTVDAYIGLGSNLKQPMQQVQSAVDALSQIVDCQLIKCSSWYQSEAIGPEGQPDYINGMVHLKTALSPHVLLDALQAIENSHQRVREVRWGPRTLDLDLILYGDQVIQTDRLTVPHPEMKHRNFVLLPLIEISAETSLPDGTPVRTLLKSCSTAGIKKIT